MMKTRDMTEGHPIRLILSVALPLMVGNIFQQLYTVVDAQVVGRVEGVSALAALGASDWFNWLLLGIIQGFAQGFTIPIAQAFGAKDYKNLRRNIGNAILLSAATIIFITVCSLFLISPVLKLLSTPDEIKHITVSYLTVIFAAFPVVMAYNLLAGILRSLGDGKSPLYAMAVASAVNIGLDLLFVAVFHWGVIGAAIATVIAQCCSCLFCLYRLSKIDIIKLQRDDLRPDGRICLRLLRLSAPVAAQNGIIGVGGMFVQSIVNTLGVTFIAGYTATNKLYGVLEIAAISYGYAVSTYSGQNLGAGKLKRIRKGTHGAAITGIITAAAIAGAMFIFGRMIVGSFISGTPDEVSAATEIACEFLYIMSSCLPILYILHIYRSSLLGMGITVMPMISGIVELFMRIGAAILLPGIIGYKGVFFAEVLAWLGADVILVASYYIYLHLSNRKSVKSASEITI